MEILIKQLKEYIESLDKKDKNWRNKKIKARFICALSICYLNKKIASVIGKIEGYISKILGEKMVLDMIQFLFQKKRNKLLVK